MKALMAAVRSWWPSRCAHARIRGVYGDEIIACGWYRLACVDCERYLDGGLGLITHKHSFLDDAYVPVAS